ncbi:RcnB family protein [Sphingobium tyrosinilyticum]|uniref:RcnB family protein n=1 Tax=Sphingobium tyrosinilyticum TaxID=2715436 RepID=A0ABV9EZX0_9SPHN
MRIWSIMLASASIAVGASAPASAGEAVLAGAALPVMGKSFTSPGVRHGGIRGGSAVHRWGPRFQGRWFAGWHAPGGWTAYRRPVVGYVLPSYWINPSYRIGNYGGYGLPAPVDGYGWSRYYDDAVMVDRHGRVRDHRSDVDWDAHDGGDLPRGAPYDDDVTAHDGPPPPHEYEGRWTGTWTDDKGRTVSGEYEGRFEGEARSNYGVEYNAPPYAASPAVVHHSGPGQPVVTTTQAPGYIAGGYYYPGATTTTVVVTPTITETSYVTDVSSHRRHGAKRQCNCK